MVHAGILWEFNNGVYQEVLHGFGHECELHEHPDQMVILCGMEIAVNSSLHYSISVHPLIDDNKGSY